MSNTKIAILLCTYQGECFLEKQLISISEQIEPHWTIYASDDGSTDNTVHILKKYATLWGNNKLVILQGPKNGFAMNFMSLIQHSDIHADFYALADQDDLWESDKLTRAIRQLTTLPPHLPGLYCTRTHLIDESDKSLGYTTLYTKPPCFKNALVQNIAGGNTMVLNHSARKLLFHTPANVKIALHDWWIYLVMTGCGGQVIYDSYPSVHYRQHSRNQIGANQSFLSLLFRIKLLLKGQFANWNDMNIQALSLISNLLTQENQICFHQYSEARHQSFIPRLWGLAKSGVFRQTLSGNIKLLGAALLKKI
jgi:glycosyltransferase involved in cell wall biosynthesis